MARRTKAARAPERRSRGEIDRNYFYGEIFIKTGVAVGVALGAIALYTPFTIADALRDGMTEYLAVMTGFGLLGATSFLFGRHLRKQATHWDFD